MVAAIVVTIEDEGHFKKSFSFSPNVKLKKVLDLYRSHVCDRCSDANKLDFWFETSKIRDGHTAETLGMVGGDIIDVLMTEQCTRGACPTTSTQTIPNIHYIDSAHLSSTAQVNEVLSAPPAPKRIRMKFKDANEFKLVFRTRYDSPMVHAMRAFASSICREPRECRFLFDGEEFTGTQTPSELRLKQDDMIQVFFEVWGGGIAY